MFKAVYLVKRKPGSTYEEFRSHQLDTHVPIVLTLPGLQRYTIDLFPPSPEGDQQFDAMATVWFSDRAAHDAALSSGAGQAAVADLALFLDLPAMVVLMGETAVEKAF